MVLIWCQQLHRRLGSSQAPRGGGVVHTLEPAWMDEPLCSRRETQASPWIPQEWMFSSLSLIANLLIPYSLGLDMDMGLSCLNENLCKLACRKMSSLFLCLCEEIWSSLYNRIFYLLVKVLEEFALVSSFCWGRLSKALLSLCMKCMQYVEAAISGQGHSVRNPGRFALP